MRANAIRLPEIPRHRHCSPVDMKLRTLVAGILALVSFVADSAAAQNYYAARYVKGADAMWTHEDGFVADHAYVVQASRPVKESDVPDWAEKADRLPLVPLNMFVVVGSLGREDWTPSP